MVSDHEGLILEINQELLEVVGGDALGWTGQSMDKLIPVPSRIFLQTHIWPMLMREGQVQEIKLQILGAGGERIPVLTNCQRNVLNDAPCYHWVFFVSKERSLFENELLQAKKRAESTLDLLRVSETALKQSLLDKESLIKEVHHRVKNNLQVITSLLRLESGRSAIAEVKSVLGDMQNRIRTMSTLHETLYRTGTLASVDLGSYLKQLSIHAFKTQSVNSDAVRLNHDLGSVQVGMDQAVTCGLLVNELVSNCLKHGFPKDQPGQISVVLKPIKQTQQWRRCVSDTGVGLPVNFEDKRKDSLGLQLVGDLATQLGGVLDIASNPTNGVAFTVSFKVIESVLDQESL